LEWRNAANHGRGCAPPYHTGRCRPVDQRERNLAHRSYTATFNSNAAVFTVLSLVPTISGLTPNHQSAEAPSFTLSVAGTKFAPNAVVLWNGSPLPTTFVNATLVTAQVDTALLALGQPVAVAVRNGSPDGETTQSLTFIVDPLSGKKFIYLPAVQAVHQ
jgi:hypothetical protein